MKNEKLIYALGTLLIIGGAVMHLFHIPYANAILLLSFASMSVFQSWHVNLLKRKVKELESKS